ncbi:MAG: serine/threonine-protein kinase [Bdellovibrionota bacterium]
MDKPVTLRYKPGDTIKSRYAVLELCGAGGMGSIYKVRDTTKENRIIALKVLNLSAMQEDASAMERFRREAVVASELKHPNIVQVYEFNIGAEHPPSISMEYIDGISFEERIASRTLPKLTFSEVERILHKVAQGLAYAHQRTVIHRDLKPANIMLGKDGCVKLSDFGLCRTEHFNQHLTTTGECVGTPLYMAPEQISGGRADARSDIYSFGILAYEAATGELPFNGDSWFQIAEKHLKAPLPPLPAGIPEWFHVMLEICTSKNPDERFSNGQELLAALEEQLNASRSAPILPKKASGGGHALFAGIGTAVCLFLCVGLLLAAGIYSGAMDSLVRRIQQNDKAAVAVPSTPLVTPDPQTSRKRPASQSEPQRRKMFLCKRGGTTMFTNDPPKGLDCFEAK